MAIYLADYFWDFLSALQTAKKTSAPGGICTVIFVTKNNPSKFSRTFSEKGNSINNETD